MTSRPGLFQTVSNLSFSKYLLGPDCVPGTILGSQTQWGAEQTSRNQSEHLPLIEAQPRTRQGVRRVPRAPGRKFSIHASKHWVRQALARDLCTLGYTQYEPGAQTWVVQKQEMTRGCSDCC